MAYPLPPDFSSSSPYAAWWQYARDDGSTNVCAATGGAVLSKLRAALGMAPGAWDDGVQSALVARAASLAGGTPSSAWATLIDRLRADAQSRTVGAASLAFGLWVAYYQPYGERLDALVVPPGSVPFSWGAAPSSGDPTLVCWDPSSQPRPELLNAAQLSAASAQSYAGIRGTPSAPQAPMGGPAGPQGLALALIGLGFALVVGGTYVATRPRKRARR